MDEIFRRRCSSEDEVVALTEVLLQVLGHTEGLDLLGAEHGGHQLVRGEPLLVLRVLGKKM